MSQPTQETITVPGIHVGMKFQIGQPVQPVASTTVTGRITFEQIKSLLTTKPLRRPNRTKPIK